MIWSSYSINRYWRSATVCLQMWFYRNMWLRPRRRMLSTKAMKHATCERVMQRRGFHGNEHTGKSRAEFATGKALACNLLCVRWGNGGGVCGVALTGRPTTPTAQMCLNQLLLVHLNVNTYIQRRHLWIHIAPKCWEECISWKTNQ